MLDAELATDLVAEELVPGFLRPDYDGFTVSRIPATAASMSGLTSVRSFRTARSTAW